MKKILDAQGFVHIEGDLMKGLLLEHEATDRDLQMLESGAIHASVPQDQQPVMRHRKIAYHRMLLNTSNQEIFPADINAVIDIPGTEISSDKS